MLTLLLALSLAQATVEDAARDQWQRPADLIEAADVRPGQRVADIGAGEGYLTLKLARAVGVNGRVVAVDVNLAALAVLRARLDAAQIENVQVVVGRQDDPRLDPASLDAAILLFSLGRMPDPNAMVRQMARALKPGGRLVICDADYATATVIAFAEGAGFVLIRREEAFVRNGPRGVQDYGLVVFTLQPRIAAVIGFLGGFVGTPTARQERPDQDRQTGADHDDRAEQPLTQHAHLTIGSSKKWAVTSTVGQCRKVLCTAEKRRGVS